MLGLTGQNAQAATTPSLGAAATYGLYAADTYTNTSATTTINGDVGFTTTPAQDPLGIHTNYGFGAPYATAGANIISAKTILDNESCGNGTSIPGFTFPVGTAIELANNAFHSSTVYTPGVYCIDGALSISSIGTNITLNGAGTYIFRTTPAGALNVEGSRTVTLTGGANACDVFWTPNGATTINVNASFVGTVIPVSQPITVLANASWTGRALTANGINGDVTTGAGVTITAPTCSVAPANTETFIPANTGTITVVKTVINDNDGAKTVSDFPLFVNGTRVFSGETNIFLAPAAPYVITETTSSNYTRSFSGDCDSSGRLNLNRGVNTVCIITNNDIGAPVVPPVPPLIDVVKVPSPLALPNGPGPVTYTYTLRNVGTVPVTNIKLIGDTCSPIVLVSGDTNSDGIMGLNETWVHTCTTRLTETHTNTVVATGWANGISATDIANATVIVGLPVVPPLIHVTKVPSQFTLSAKGGMITYTEQITNPGTVALTNVHLTDDKCSPMNFVSGDLNKDAKLDTSETWTYTCRTKLTKTTTNTAVASGEANGMSVRDFAVATVVVAAVVPALPNTGFGPQNGSILLAIVVAGVLSLISTLVVLAIKKQK